MDYIGRLVLSTAGHDKGIPFCVLSEDGEYVFLADGRHRKVDSPKRKKLKHTKLISEAAYSGPVTNKAIRAFITKATALLNN